MRIVFFLLALSLVVLPSVGQDLPFSSADNGDPTVLAKTVPELARVLLVQSRGEAHDTETYFRLQLVAGDWQGALAGLKALRAARASDSSPRIRARDTEYIIYAQAELAGGSFDAAYARAFRTTVDSLDNRTAAIVVNGLSFDNLTQARQALDGDLGRLKGKTSIAANDALQLVRDYNEVVVYTAFGSQTAQLIAEDDARRYILQKDVVVTMPDGTSVCAIVARPAAAPRLPALLEFTIYNDPGFIIRDARRTASNGYVGVVGLTRGKGCGRGPIVPFEHDGADAATLINWIAEQPWSDGRVGMYGGSYSGFTPWSAAKYRPKALKAIMVGAPNGPGIDSPMEGNVVWSFVYPWTFYTTNNKTIDNATYNENDRWNKLNHDWYVSGRRYRDLDKIDGTPNPIFDRWLEHPDYDSYWQSLIPYGREFSALNIAVLQTAGYYSGGPGAASYYFSQYLRYAPKAENDLIIGPYDHFLAQRGTASSDGNITTLDGLTLDPAALTDFSELRYRWFDFILRGGPRPSILSDRVNYEVPGANIWKHAPSFDAMARSQRRFYLSATPPGNTLRLNSTASHAAFTQTINFADRSDVDRQARGGGVQDKDLDATNALVFVSEPFAIATELSGLFAARLSFVTNKKDFDFQVSLYEQKPDGEYVQLAPYWSRASYVGDISHRHLLTPGKLQTLAFRSQRLMSRLLAAGSRLVVVLSVIKEPGREINYGTGKTVADETIADAGSPLIIRWLGDSYVTVPLGR